jgi:hypothetical protein
VPTKANLRPFGYFSEISTTDAASLNLTFVGGASFSEQSQVMVWRQGSTWTCPSTDGKYTLTYGGEWDAAVAISQTSLSGKVGFATIAANAQINNSSTSFDYVAAGYTNFDTWQGANATLFKDVSTNGLTVDNFSKFNADFGAMVDAAKTMTVVDPPPLIGYAPAGTADLSRDLAAGYAIMFIAKGQSCTDAVKAFPVKDAWVDPAIRTVYTQLSAGKSDCDPKADPAEQAVAAQLLSGITIKRP